MWNRDADGRMRWIERYRGGRPHGLWVRFSREGSPRERREYENAKLHGPWELYDDQGRAEVSGRFEQGRKVGVFEGRQRSGKLDYVARFRRGVPAGEWLFYDRNGKVEATCRYGADGRIKGRTIRGERRELQRIDVLERLAQLKSPVKFCYDRELALRETLARRGSVEFRFLVTPAGLTAAIELARSTFKDRELETCIADILQQTKFPRLLTCEVVEVAFPFELSASEP